MLLLRQKSLPPLTIPLQVIFRFNFEKEFYNAVAGDPKRHRALVINAATPFNAETPLELITESFITPADLFYVRNHLPVPIVDPDTWELEVIKPSFFCTVLKSIP